MTDDRKELLRLFIDQAPAAIAMFDSDMRYIAASRRWLSDYGLGNRDLRGLSHYEVFPEIPERWRAVHRRGLNGEVVIANEDRFERADGTVQWLRWEVRPWYNEVGKQGGVVIFTDDITELKHAEERFRIIVEASPSAMLLVDARGIIMLVNNRAEQLFGYSRDELVGLPVDKLLPEDVRTAHAEFCKKFYKAPAPRSMGAMRDLLGQTKDGRLVPIEVGLAPIDNDKGCHVLVTIIDITERKQAEERILRLNAELEQRVRARTTELEESVAALRQALNDAENLRKELREQAIRDPLTRLYNRRYLQEALEHEVSRAKRARSVLGIIMFDVDNFKQLNDKFGHVAGDEVLRGVGQVVLANLRDEDIACRYGGDEFIILLPDTPLKAATQKAAQLRARLKQSRLELQDARLPEIQFSIGVSAFPDQGLNANELLLAVDAALYRAKREGRDQVVCAD